MKQLNSVIGTTTYESFLVNQVNDSINLRSEIAQEIQEATENGKVALVWSSSDCDGTSSTGSAHIPVPTSIYKIYMQQHGYGQDNEGPSATWYKKPSQNPEYRDTQYSW
tara:strand:+ start:95 stop:421 length:327 start_codon:yes stop_codon:yes gene_type:complete